MKYTTLSRQVVVPADGISRGRVLIVSESSDFLRTYHHIVAELGLSALVVNSYAAALELLDGEAFSLVLVDQGTRAFEGRCILSRLSQDRCPAPAMVITRCRSFSCFRQATRLGAVAYLEEPVDAAGLARRIVGQLEPSATGKIGSTGERGAVPSTRPSRSTGLPLRAVR